MSKYDVTTARRTLMDRKGLILVTTFFKTLFAIPGHSKEHSITHAYTELKQQLGERSEQFRVSITHAQKIRELTTFVGVDGFKLVGLST